MWFHSHPFFAAALEPAIRAKGAKLIYHAGNSFTVYPSPSRLFRSFTADAYIFASEAVRQEALRLVSDLKNTYAIHNGADENSS